MILHTTRECIGCGWCCIKGPCAVAFQKLPIEEALRLTDRPGSKWRGCKLLVWDGERHWCGPMLESDEHHEAMAVGAGCCAGLNTWRFEPLQDRRKD